MKKIIFITNSYPYKESRHFIFLKNIVDEFVKHRHDCVVIEHQNLLKVLFGLEKYKPRSREVFIDENTKYNVISLKVLLLPEKSFFRKIIGKINRILLNFKLRKFMKKSEFKIDFIYSHHMITAGYLAYKLSISFRKPHFISLGESNLDRIAVNFPDKLLKNIFINSSGVITVSTEMKNELKKKPYFDPAKAILVAPNGVNLNRFKQYDKRDFMRGEMGISENDFVIAFNGSFNYRKGIERLDDALKNLNKSEIKAIFIGDGPYKPEYKQLIFCGALPNDKIPYYLNLADIFVLPTIREGCSNAILEAMACGLPIISSNLPFNDDILTNNNAVRINSLSVKEISNSILHLKENKSLKQNMGQNSLKYSQNFSITNRALKILDYIYNKSV